MEPTLSIEQAFAALDKLLKEMENPELPLEESFEKYNQSLELIKLCNASIDKIEKKMIILEEG